MDPLTAQLIGQGVSEALGGGVAASGVVDTSSNATMQKTGGKNIAAGNVSVSVPNIVGNAGEILKPYMEGPRANGGFGFIHPSRWTGRVEERETATANYHAEPEPEKGPNLLLIGGVGVGALLILGGGFYFGMRF